MQSEQHQAIRLYLANPDGNGERGNDVVATDVVKQISSDPPSLQLTLFVPSPHSSLIVCLPLPVLVLCRVKSKVRSRCDSHKNGRRNLELH